MEGRRWFNPSQPQTLQIAVWLLYFNGVIGLLLPSVFALLGVLGLVALVGCVVGGFGIANDRKWGYGLGVVVAALQVLLYIWAVDLNIVRLISSRLVISFAFAVALLAALLHPMSRDYQRIWFR
jgi:hypothetical protein